MKEKNKNCDDENKLIIPDVDEGGCELGEKTRYNESCVLLNFLHLNSFHLYTYYISCSIAPLLQHLTAYTQKANYIISFQFISGT